MTNTSSYSTNIVQPPQQQSKVMTRIGFSKALRENFLNIPSGNYALPDVQ